MKRILLNILLLFPCTAFAQNVDIVKFDFINSILKNTSDTTYVINFWASWCSPCVKELPAFEELNSKNQDKKFKVILVSLNFKSEYDNQLMPFVKNRKMNSQIVLLDEPDYNSWIDKIDKNWGGAIPSTLIINNSKNVKQFYEKEFTLETLEKTINLLIN